MPCSLRTVSRALAKCGTTSTSQGWLDASAMAADTPARATCSEHAVKIGMRDCQLQPCSLFPTRIEPTPCSATYERNVSQHGLAHLERAQPQVFINTASKQIVKLGAMSNNGLKQRQSAGIHQLLKRPPAGALHVSLTHCAQRLVQETEQQGEILSQVCGHTCIKPGTKLAQKQCGIYPRCCAHRRKCVKLCLALAHVVRTLECSQIRAYCVALG